MTEAGRVVLAGNNAAAIGVLDLLLEALPPEAILAVAPPQSVASTWQASLVAASSERGVVCISPDDVNDDETLALVSSHRPKLLLSIYYTQLFREALLSAIDGPVLNFHPSLLPRHRGHAPIIWAIVEGDAVTGLSVHHIDTGVDTGPLVYRRSLPIHPRESGFDLHRKMALLVHATAADLLRHWLAGEALPPAIEQTGTASVHSRRDPQVNHLDWTQPVERLRNIVRALAPPLPGAFARYEGTEVGIVEVEVVAPGSLATHPVGMVEQDSGSYPLVWASDGPLRLRRAVRDGELIDGRELGLPNGALLH